MGNLLAELKRRHIYRVAAAYAVVAWVLIQLVNNITPMLKLPDWIGTAVLVLLAVGFPIALLFAWIQKLASDDGAAARATTGKLDWALIGALVVVIVLVSYQQLTPATGAKSALPEAGVGAARSASATQVGAISIAVLPFVNVTGDASQEFFSDGLTDEISGALAKVPDLRVVARQSAFQFKGEKKDARAVGQALGATHLIEGSVRKAGNRVRISAELVQADNGLNLWSENYDRELTDIFAIQEDIATAIATSLRMPLGLRPGENLVNNRTKDETTYEDYLRAKALVRARGGADSLARLMEAARLLEQVVAREPDFSPAWAQLGLAYVGATVFQSAIISGATEQWLPIMEMYLPKADAAAQRAVALDAKNADAYAVLGWAQHVRGKWSMADGLYMRALALDPTNPDGLELYSIMLASLGYVKQALPLREELQTVERSVPIYTSWSAQIMWAGGQTDRPIAMLRLLPTGAASLGNLGRIYAAQGRYGEAADVLQSIPKGTYLPGITEAAVRLLRTAPAAAASPQTLPRLGSLEFVYLYVGAPDRVLDFYEEPLKVGYQTAVPVNLWAPPYKGLRKTERFRAYLRAAGMVDYWRAKGWPDLCRPMGADDFVCE